MNFPKFSHLSVTTCFLAFGLASCNKPQPIENLEEVNWLVGTWVVDRDKTTKKFISGALDRFDLNADNIKNKIALSLVKKMSATTIAGVIKPLDNLEFKFTENFEYSKEGIGFGGEGLPYKVISRPSANQITICEGGANRTYTKEGKWIWYTCDIKIGGAKIYLKRKRN